MSKFNQIMGSVEEPDTKQVLQDLSIFQTFEGLSYFLHLFIAGQGSIAHEKELYCLGNPLKKHFSIAGPFFWLKK